MRKIKIIFIREITACYSSLIMNALLAISLLVCLTGATAFQEVSSPEYIALTAAQKSEIIWSNVMEDLTPADWFGILELPGIFTESMCPTIRAPGKRWSRGED